MIIRVNVPRRDLGDFFLKIFYESLSNYLPRIPESPPFRDRDIGTLFGFSALEPCQPTSLTADVENDHIR